MSENAIALLTPAQLAERLSVPQSWIREKTRNRARVRDADPLPVLRLGKYCRFDWSNVAAWLARQSANVQQPEGRKPTKPRRLDKS
jgi:hypothetical protein